MEIVWTRLAKVTYIEVFENLKKRWTKREMKKFKTLTEELLDKVKEEKVIHPFVNEKLGIRKAKVHKNVSIYYRINNLRNMIEIITFFNNRMNPETLKKLLK